MNDTLIEKENILYGLDVKNFQEVISILSDKLYENGQIIDKNTFIEAVYERESQIPTSIGKEIAIPHGKSRTVTNSTVTLGVLNKPIKWNDNSDDLVKYVFLLTIKDGDEGENHLRTLAELSSRLMHSEFVSSLKNTQSQEEIYKVINNLD